MPVKANRPKNLSSPRIFFSFSKVSQSRKSLATKKVTPGFQSGDRRGTEFFEKKYAVSHILFLTTKTRSAQQENFRENDFFEK